MQYNSRADWQAQPPRNGLSNWGSGMPIGIAVHYVGGGGSIGLAGKPHSACLTLCHNLQNYAFSGGNGWTYSDIEYNLFACPHGWVIEGRGLDHEGAAQKGANQTHASICALANVGDPVDAGLATALRDAVSLTRQHFGHDLAVVGHRDTAGNPTGTNCPGDTIEAWLPQAGQPAPPPPAPPQPTEESTMNIWYQNATHTFWVDDASHLQHTWGTSVENMMTKYVRTEAADKTRPIHGIVEPDGTLQVACGVGGGRLLVLRFKGAWSASVRNPA